MQFTINKYIFPSCVYVYIWHVCLYMPLNIYMYIYIYNSYVFMYFSSQRLIFLGIYHHNAPFVTEMCTHFCYKMVQCGIWDWCIVNWVKCVVWSSSRRSIYVMEENAIPNGLDEIVILLFISGLLQLHVSWSMSLQWRQNGHNSVSHHQPHDCLLNRLFRCRSKKTLKLRVTGLCAQWIPRTHGQ